MILRLTLKMLNLILAFIKVQAELHSKDIYSRLSKLSEQNKRKSEEKLEDVDGQNKPETAVKESYFSKTGFITERKNNGTTPPRQPSVVLKGLEKVNFACNNLIFSGNFTSTYSTKIQHNSSQPC